jgi:hypothetical protein
LIISGIVDIGIGLLILTSTLSINKSHANVFIVCLAIGSLYLLLGLGFALIKIKKQTK